MHENCNFLSQISTNVITVITIVIIMRRVPTYRAVTTVNATKGFTEVESFAKVRFEKALFKTYSCMMIYPKLPSFSISKQIVSMIKVSPLVADSPLLPNNMELSSEAMILAVMNAIFAIA